MLTGRGLVRSILTLRCGARILLGMMWPRAVEEPATSSLQWLLFRSSLNSYKRSFSPMRRTQLGYTPFASSSEASPGSSQSTMKSSSRTTSPSTPSWARTTPYGVQSLRRPGLKSRARTRTLTSVSTRTASAPWWAVPSSTTILQIRLHTSTFGSSLTTQTMPTTSWEPVPQEPPTL